MHTVQIIKCGDMPISQIADMDIVTHTCPINCRVIIAPNIQVLALASRHLRHVRHKIIGQSLRGFTNQARFMCTHRIKVAQASNPPLRISLIHIGEDIFYQQLGATIRVGGRPMKIFTNRHVSGIAINGGRGRKDQRLYCGSAHGGE